MKRYVLLVGQKKCFDSFENDDVPRPHQEIWTGILHGHTVAINYFSDCFCKGYLAIPKQHRPQLDLCLPCLQKFPRTILGPPRTLN